MPINTPLEHEISSAMIDDLVARTFDPALRIDAHPLNILANVMAASLSDLYGQLDIAIGNSFVNTAQAQDLDRLGNVWNLKRADATKATGTVIFTGSVGSLIPANTKLASTAGVQFMTSNDASTAIGADGTVEIGVQALAGGILGNLPEDDILALANPLTGIAPSVTISTGGTKGGEEAEGDSAYRARLLLQVRNPAKGGALSDYEAWVLDRNAHDVPCSKAFITPPSTTAQAGTVAVEFCVEDGDDLLSAPTSQQITAVKNYLEKVRPVGALITAAAPTLETLDITLISTTTETGISLEDAAFAIKTDLNALFLRNATRGGSIALSQLYETIAGAAGVKSFTLTAPTGNSTPSHSNGILKLGTLTVE